MSKLVVDLITVPLFMGAIGYLTNLSGVWMLFNPLVFKGVKVPGLKTVSRFLPRKLQQVPGVMHGGIGWQGIIPSRTARMGSIAVDMGIAKLGSPAEFYQQLEPEKIAQRILVEVENDVPRLVDDVVSRERPELWAEIPPLVKQMIYGRVRNQMPAMVHHITAEIGKHIDQLLDVKLMVIRKLEERPDLANRVYEDVGRKELRFMINFGFFFAFLLGFPVVALTETVHYWWVLPIAGTFVGWATNLVGIWMIFEPVEPRKILGVRVQGLFIRRQHEVADIYSQIIAEEVVTLSNIGDELLNGPRSDRTRRLLEDLLRPAIDESIGFARPALRLVVGRHRYGELRDSAASNAVSLTMAPFLDPEFNRLQSDSIRVLIRDRLREMSPHDYVEMLRSAMKEDEWLLFLHGAVLGFGAGLLHLGIFG